MAKNVVLDPRMKKAFKGLKGNTKKYLQEACEESMIPSRQNPVVSKELTYEMYPYIFGAGGFIAKSLGKSIDSQEAEVFKERISSAVNSLTQTLIELEMKMKTKASKNYDLKNKASLSDFQHPDLKGFSGNKADVNKSVEVNRYIRLALQTMIYSSLKPIFATSKNDIIALVKRLKIDEMPFTRLHQNKSRVEYAKLIGSISRLAMAASFQEIDVSKSRAAIQAQIEKFQNQNKEQR